MLCTPLAEMTWGEAARIGGAGLGGKDARTFADRWGGVDEIDDPYLNVTFSGPLRSAFVSTNGTVLPNFSRIEATGVDSRGGDNARDGGVVACHRWTPTDKLAFLCVHRHGAARGGIHERRGGKCRASTSHTAAPSSHGVLFTPRPSFPLTAKERAAARSRTMHRGGTRSATSLALGAASHGDETPSTTSEATTSAAPLTASTPPDDLADFAGTAQATAIHDFGADQEITPPNEDIAAGPADIVEVVNSTIYIFSRTGAILGSADLNMFMDVVAGYHSSDPRVIYDASAGTILGDSHRGPRQYRRRVTAPNRRRCSSRFPGRRIHCRSRAGPCTDCRWRHSAVPPDSHLTEFGDQPGLGISTNTVTVTFDDYTCDNLFNGSEIDVLQKTDFETDSGISALYYFCDGPFAPQPVQGLGAM